MAKIHIIIFVIVSSSILITDARILPQERAKKTSEFRVYIHEWLSGANATVHEVARAKIISTSPLKSFGLVTVADSIVTDGPDLTSSEKLGRVQGLTTYSGLEEPAVTMNFNLVFTRGKYKGSTLNNLGWKLTSNVNEELIIGGGTGVFRGVGGYTISNTHSYNSTTGYLVLIYDLYVVYD